MFAKLARRPHNRLAPGFRGQRCALNNGSAMDAKSIVDGESSGAVPDLLTTFHVKVSQIQWKFSLFLPVRGFDRRSLVPEAVYWGKGIP